MYSIASNMGNNSFKIVALLLNLYLVAGTNEVLKFIPEYFARIQITHLNLFLCYEKDSLYLRKHAPFAKFLSRIYTKRRINFHDVETTPSGFFIDLGCDFNKQLFEEIPEVLFTSGYNWLVKGSAEESMPLLENASLGLSSSLALVLPDLTLLDFYKLHHSSELKMKKCENLGGLPCPLKKTRFDLKGITLKATVLNFLHVSDDDEGKRKFDLLIRNKGFDPNNELFIHTYYIMNGHLAYLFNYNISLVLADTYGYKMPNGTYNGMIKLLQEKEADITLTPLAMLVERLDLVDYFADLESVQFIFVFLEERTLGGVTALIVPFTRNVWLANFLIFTLSVIVSSYIFYIYHPTNLISEAILNVIGVVCAQGVLEMNVTSSRIINFFLLIFGLLLATYYNASIMNGLLSPAPVLIKDVKDVLNSRKIGISNITYIHPIFFHPLLKEKLKQYSTYPVYGIPEGVRKVKVGDFALVGDGAVMYSEMEQIFTDSEKCSTRRVGMSTGLPMTCTGKKYSHYTEMLKIGYAWLRESGISYREKKYWYADPPHCLGGTVFKPVSGKAMSIAFCIYLFGLIVSIVVLLLELHSSKKQSRKPNKIARPRFLA